MFLLTSLLLPGSPTSSSPADCFALKVNAKVRGEAGGGIVVGARCSPSNQITQVNSIRRRNTIRDRRRYGCALVQDVVE
jgi:hypothetical protein